jgi:hypothetical protein
MVRPQINVNSIETEYLYRIKTIMAKLFTFTSDEQTDLRVLRFRLRKLIEADDAAILIEGEAHVSLHDAKCYHSAFRMEHRETAIKNLAEVELRMLTEADRIRAKSKDAPLGPVFPLSLR